MTDEVKPSNLVEMVAYQDKSVVSLSLIHISEPTRRH